MLRTKYKSFHMLLRVFSLAFIVAFAYQFGNIHAETKTTSGCNEIYAALQSDGNQDAFAPLRRKRINLNQICLLPEGEYRHEEPALFYAIRLRPSMINILLRNGASPSTKNAEGLTPLMFAAYQSNPEEIVKSLIKAGANPNQKDAQGRTFLSYFVEPNLEVRDKLISLKLAKPTLNDFMSFELQDILEGKALQIGGGGLDPTNSDLIKKRVSALIKQGANPNIKLNDDFALFETQSNDTMKFLIDIGLDCNIISPKSGLTPLMKALKEFNHDIKLIETLIAKSNNINHRDFSGSTAMHLVSYKVYVTSDTATQIRILLEAGANPNIQDNEGKTPLMNLLTEFVPGNTKFSKDLYKERYLPMLNEIISSLKRFRIDFTLKDKTGKNAGQIAKEMEHHWEIIARVSP